MAVDVLSLVGLPQSTHSSHSFHLGREQYDFSMVINYYGSQPDLHIKQCIEYIKNNAPFSSETVYQLIEKLIEICKGSGVIECSTVLKNKQLIISAAYNGSVGLLRNKKTGFLLSNKETIQLVEGKWKEGDYYCIVTAGALKTADELLARLKQGFDPINTIVISASSFHDTVSELGGAIRIITFDEEFEVELPFVENAVQELEFATRKMPELEESVQEQVLPRNELYTLLKNKLPVNVLQNTYNSLGKNRKKTSIVIAIAGIIFALALFLIISYFQTRNEKINALESRLMPLKQELITIKNNDNQNTFQTKESVSRIIQELQTIKAETEKEGYLQKIIDADIEGASIVFDTAAEKNVLDNVPTFFDLRDIKSDFIASDMTIVDREIALIDTETKSLILLNSDDKTNQLIELTAEKVINLASSNKSLFILTNGIQQIDREDSQSSPTEIIKTSDQIAEASFIGAYEDYAYIVNKPKRNIYRYVITDDSINPIPWLRSARGLDFDAITDIAIDGKIWISTNKGEIYSFLQGTDQPFAVPSLSPPLESALKMYTTVESEQLYILEPKQKRIVIIKKNGEFVKEVKNETFASASDIAADESTNKIFILNGSIIAELPIND